VQSRNLFLKTPEWRMFMLVGAGGAEGDGIYHWADPRYLGSSVQIQSERRGARKGGAMSGPTLKRKSSVCFGGGFYICSWCRYIPHQGQSKRGSVKGLECVVPKSKTCLRNFTGPLNFCGHIIFTNITQKYYWSYSRIWGKLCLLIDLRSFQLLTSRCKNPPVLHLLIYLCLRGR
jgi:hypothetical protein